MKTILILFLSLFSVVMAYSESYRIFMSRVKMYEISSTAVISSSSDTKSVGLDVYKLGGLVFETNLIDCELDKLVSENISQEDSTEPFLGSGVEFILSAPDGKYYHAYCEYPYKQGDIQDFRFVLSSLQQLSSDPVFVFLEKGGISREKSLSKVFLSAMNKIELAD